MEYLQIPIPPGTTPRIVYGNKMVTVHFDTTPTKQPLEKDDAQETADDGSVDAAVSAEGDDVRVQGKMARKSPNAEQLAFAHRLVVAIDKPAELTQIFTERYDSLPGDEHIEKHRKYIFQIAKGQNSVLSLAQEIDASIETIKMGSIPALKEYNAKKIAHQDAAQQLVQANGKVRISDPQGLYRKLCVAAEKVIQATPSPETILLAEDLIAFSLELRQNEACPLKMRNDEHQLSSTDFLIENNICTFSGGSKTHDGQPRAPFAKVCLFPDRIMLGLITHVFDNMRPKMSNGATTAKALANLEKNGILGHFETITKPFQRRDMRGARFSVPDCSFRRQNESLPRAWCYCDGPGIAWTHECGHDGNLPVLSIRTRRPSQDRLNCDDRRQAHRNAVLTLRQELDVRACVEVWNAPKCLTVDLDGVELDAWSIRSSW